MGFCSSSSSAQEKVIVGHSARAALSIGHLLYGIERGFYRDEGIDLVYVSLRADLGIKALLSGDIDLFKFPVPLWHERDGGRYIGTGHVVITRDPDEDWVNVGCYRVMVHDRNSMGMNISPGKHGRMHRQKYFDRGKACPRGRLFRR
ncbi:MAG: UbiD family decarboxylase [Deltaproteobacteria bacterium]|nr:MAG: UbiD family decarboxylase [Deltaproteobacteria bacterium]